MRGGWAAGALLGGAGVWFLDPLNGKRRRVIARDKTRRALRLTWEGVGLGARDLVRVTSGAFAEAQAALLRDTASDRVVKARIRSTLGRLVQHPGAIQVTVRSGMAVLSGPILQKEYEPLLDSLLSVRGVRGLESNLTVYEQAGSVPALQGGAERREAQGWRPASRFVAGSLGVVLVASAPFLPRRRRLLPLLPAALLFARASTRRTLPQMLGVGVGRRLVEIERSITIDQPFGTVARFLAREENIGEFTDDLERVETLGAGRARFQLIGPLRIRFIVETERTDDASGERISWRSVRGSPRHEVDIRLFAEEERTRVAFRFAYTPPAGFIGHGAAILLGRSPAMRLARALMRLKGLLESPQRSGQGSVLGSVHVLSDIEPPVPF